jgi:Arc/MetJ-type ribon-helix-helix transcriptional regulator
LVLASLNEAARRALEAMMASGNYEYQSELVRRNVAKGRDQGREEGALQAKVADVLAVLETRGLPIPEEVRRRVQASTDTSELDRWHRRAVLVSSAAEIFESV